MEIPIDLTPIFGGNMVRIDGLRLKQLGEPYVFQAIDRLGEMSAKAMMLDKPLTTSARMMEQPDQVLYLHWEKGEHPDQSFVTGVLKIGHKSLFVFDRELRKFQGKTLCVLDFYTHYSQQRKGEGKKLFDFMLQCEHMAPQGLALDTPSITMLAFMTKHYNLTGPIWQNTNYVVYPSFFDMLARPKSQDILGGGPVDDERPRTPRHQEACGKDGMRSSTIGDLSTEGTLANRAQTCKQRKQHILGHLSSTIGDLSTESTLANRAQTCKQRKQHILGHASLW